MISSQNFSKFPLGRPLFICAAALILAGQPAQGQAPAGSAQSRAELLGNRLGESLLEPLPIQRRIESEEQKQLNMIAKGTYIPSNLVILGRGTLVTPC